MNDNNQWNTFDQPAYNFDDLAQYDADFQPQHAFRQGLDTLADADYDMTITDAKLDLIQGKRVLRLGLKTHTGAQVEWVRWLNQQVGVNALGADLLVLGFDQPKNWGRQGHSIAVELPALVPRLVGKKFR